MMAAQFQNDWQELLQPEFLKQEYRTRTIYPDMYDIFNAMHFTAYEDVKVVILGQDPYHGPGQAHGLSFSVKPGIAVPPSLQNIYQELANDLGLKIPHTGYLKKWKIKSACELYD